MGCRSDGNSPMHYIQYTLDSIRACVVLSSSDLSLILLFPERGDCAQWGVYKDHSGCCLCFSLESPQVSRVGDRAHGSGRPYSLVLETDTPHYRPVFGPAGDSWH